MGSLFRTSDSFGVTKLYLTGYTGTPRNPIHRDKIAKVALGAENFVPWEHNKSAVRVIKQLRKQFGGITVVALENNTQSIPLQKFKPKFPLVLVLGEEVAGIGKSLIRECSVVVEIPMYGKKESLNVSVAFGIAAYEISRKMSRGKRA